MKVKPKSEVNPTDKTMEDLENFFKSAGLTGTPVPLYPTLSTEKILDAMREILLIGKPYDMEDEDWLDHPKNDFYHR